jgi:alkylhydroperoxidase/carboxymuconolactone decarboxylase family protein YurZ/quinol monooxygenase YgiN
MNRNLAVWLAATAALVVSNTTTAETHTMKNEALNAKQQSIVTIAAFTASGNLPKLTEALNEGLDAGLTLSEIKEVLVQMYAYAGFPRSLNGIGALMNVLQGREKKGIKDSPGKQPSPFPTDKSSLQLGTENQTRLIGAPATGAYIAFAPAIDQFLKSHLFGDIFGRDNLDFQTREIATIAALANMYGVEPQLQAHFRIGFNTGLTEPEMKSLIGVLAARVGQPVAENAAQVLSKTLNKEAAKPTQRVVRLARLEIHADRLESYNAALKEEIETSIRVEPGVISLSAASEKDKPTSITVFEIYADDNAYRAHIESPHFKKYKADTREMVKSLELLENVPILLGTKAK